METLSELQVALVGIGAAIGSNCEPCLAHHVDAARAAGLSDAQLRAAAATAHQVKERAARPVATAAETLARRSDGGVCAPSRRSGCCG